MNILIRPDLGPKVGGGHLMRCLTLAEAARARGHNVTFLLPDDPLSAYARNASFDYDTLPAGVSWQEDSSATINVLRTQRADWLVWDHYDLTCNWVRKIRDALPDLRVLALDDLDDRPLGSDLVLDQTRVHGMRRHGARSSMIGPSFLLLRPEFAALRARSLARARKPIQQILVTPGMLDAAGLAPLALDALEAHEAHVTVVMSAESQSRREVEARIAQRRNRSLALDVTNMAERIAASDFCIGAAGMSTWERACLGLPSLLVTVAENQRSVAEALAAKGAAISLSHEEARDLTTFRRAIAVAQSQAGTLSQKAAALCAGDGATRVLDCMEARLRPLTEADAKRLYDWRMSPSIRAASLQQEAFSFESHCTWLSRTLTRTDGLCRIYEEPAPVGFVGAVDRGDGMWEWSFYIGESDAHRGAGGRMLSQFLCNLWAETDCKRLRATVLRGNTRSDRLHLDLGFAQYAETPEGHCIYHLDRPRRPTKKGVSHVS